MTSHLLVAIATITKLFYCFLNEVSSTFGIEPILKDIESYQGLSDSYDVPICSTDTFYVFKREHLGTKVVNSKEVREVQEGATCFCDRKLSKIG